MGLEIPPAGGGGGGGSALTDQTVAQLEALSPTVGQVAYPSDAFGIVYVCRSAGVWSTIIRGREIPRSKIADWPLVRDDGSPATNLTALDANGAATVRSWGGGGIEGRFRALAATSNFEITMRLRGQLWSTGYNGAHVLLRDSGTGNVIIWAITENGFAAEATVRIWNANSAWAFLGFVYTVPVSGFMGGWNGPDWIRIKDDGTDRVYLVAYDGGEFREVARTLRTAHIVPDEIGIVPSRNVAGLNADQGVEVAVHGYQEV
jgi:hypothetical protein